MFFLAIFLLIFIPLYPKLPLLDVRNTWVYVRVEDFLVVSVLAVWAVFLIGKKITLRTPLTIPIMIFWIVGAIATIHGVVLIFPTLPNVFPNVAFLSYLRHVEYMSLFFLAYAGMKDKRLLSFVISAIILTLIGVIAYGFGQKYLGFPAFLTMNEEFAKGMPIQLSQLSRVPSTFAGHYDLAAYLVLVVPILVSLVFGFRNILIKLFLLGVSFLGLILLFMTVSRVSFFVLFAALFFVLLFQKKKLALLIIPIILISGIVFVSLQPSLFDRFGNTVREVDVVVNSQTGESIGHLKYEPLSYLDDKVLKQRRVTNSEQLGYAIAGEIENINEASPSGEVMRELLPPKIPLVVATNTSTGENLPQGTGYINLSLSPVVKRLGYFFYELPPSVSTTSGEVLLLHGNFLVKKAAAYDLSFTTRFQGEWPRALDAFKRNILFGSGYGSVSLAVDNNYFRMLGEIGLIGTLSFAAIFLTIGVYIKKILPEVDSPVVRSFVLGFVAGVIGLALNATLIDVFEASKIAFFLWLLTGIVLGTLTLYQKKDFSIFSQFKDAATSPIAIIIYLFLGSVAIFSPMLNNFFTGDDFTWFRWVADCNYRACDSLPQTILSYFTNSDSFFFRPGTKIYFLLMYPVFWLNQVVYHAVSLLLHFVVAALFFLLASKILQNKLLAGLTAALFLIASGYAEAVFWISATGFLFNAMFVLSALLLFILWEEKKNILYYCASLICIVFGLMFHEVGVVAPLLIVAYKVASSETINPRILLRKLTNWVIFLPVVGYLILRYVSQSHWFGGDYSYNIIKLPFNILGNGIGYIALIITGPISLPVYDQMRSLMRENILLAIPLGIVFVAVCFFVIRKFFKTLDKVDKKACIFGILFFVIALLPFLGLGNIASRYSYLASIGLMIVFAVILKKLYAYLLVSGKDIAVAGMGVVISIFCLLQLMQIQQTHVDWHGAGEKVQKFLVSIDGLYSNYWSQEPVELHFANVPVKDGEAWVFPVGLNDAVWFAFKNPDITVISVNSVEDALARVGSPNLTKRILRFEGDGGVSEVITVVRGSQVFYQIQDKLYHLDENHILQEVGLENGER